jgi:hypothetical protein
MTDQDLIETSARAILISNGHVLFEDDEVWEGLCDHFIAQSRKGDVSGIAPGVIEAFRVAEVVVGAIRPLPAPNPGIVIDWQQQDDRTWTADIADGWSARVRHGFDDTWSFVVNQSGRCYLDSRETAIRLAEENARARIADAIREAASTSRAFGLGLPIEARDEAA